MLRVAEVVSFGEFVLDAAEARLLGPSGPVHLGPKAFRVLEALVARSGNLLTKDSLFETVWDGTTVSESALTAVIKELRRALRDEARSPRFIENVYGRGYRFIAPVTRPERTSPSAEYGATTGVTRSANVPPARTASRRRVIGWAAAAGIGGVAALFGASLGTRRYLQARVPPEVDQLIMQARHLMDQNTSEGQYEAIGLLRRVTDLAPAFADGWGLLGMSYAIPSHYRDVAEGMELRAQARAAGARALALDPSSSYGELALGLELPIIGHWAERDRRFDRALADRPDNDDVSTFIAVILQFNGRVMAALSFYDRIRQRPLTPAAYSNYIRALWSAGRIEETDRAIEDAIALYPTQTTIWFDRFDVWLFGGRPDEAAALVRNPSGRPSRLDEQTIDFLLAQCAAVRDPKSRQARDTLDQLVRDAHRNASDAQAAIRLAAALGATDVAFELTDAYYFSRGFAVPDYPRPGSAASLDQRQTRLLFEPETVSLRADPRFERLVAEIGLDAYWRESGKPPDYRRSRTRAI